MNLQIISNSMNKKGDKNSINDFTMSLDEPINCENRNYHITVLNVSYPLTTKNIIDDECYFNFVLNYANFRQYDKCEFQFTSKKFVIPDGVYTMEHLLSFMNSCLNEYDISIEQTDYGKIIVYFHMSKKLCFKQNKTSSGSTAWNGRASNVYHNVDYGGKADVELNLSKKLKFMLGFDEKKKLKVSRNTNSYLTPIDIDDATKYIVGDYLPDISDGVNNIFIYCDQVMKMSVGDTKANLLAIVPLQIKGQGSGETFDFEPPAGIKRKLIKSLIRDLHITLRNSRDELINFESGVVQIDCVIDHD